MTRWGTHLGVLAAIGLVILGIVENYSWQSAIAGYLLCYWLHRYDKG